MKTIDEVILEARESAKYHRDKKNNLLRTEDNLQQHLTMAEESDQLADWLEEYKAYKEIGTVQGCHNCEFQPSPIQTCDWLRTETTVHMICPRWKKRGSEQ